MKIVDLNGAVFSAVTDAEINSIFAIRNENNANEFWISAEDQDFPTLEIMVKDDVACLQYFSNEDDAGCISVGDKSAEGYSLFYVNAGEEQDISNDLVVPAAKALEALREFLKTNELPRSIEWLALAQ